MNPITLSSYKVTWEHDRTTTCAEELYVIEGTADGWTVRCGLGHDLHPVPHYVVKSARRGPSAKQVLG